MDMQYATNVNPDRNPYLAEHFFDEIHAAYQHSRGCFLLVSFVNDNFQRKISSFPAEILFETEIEELLFSFFSSFLRISFHLSNIFTLQLIPFK